MIQTESWHPHPGEQIQLLDPSRLTFPLFSLAQVLQRASATSLCTACPVTRNYHVYVIVMASSLRFYSERYAPVIGALEVGEIATGELDRNRVREHPSMTAR